MLLILLRFDEVNPDKPDLGKSEYEVQVPIMPSK